MPDVASSGGDRPAGGPFATRSPVLARNGLAATSHPLATQAGVDALRDGGTAVDAAVAANAVLAVAEPTGCGPGGDLFALVWDPASRALHGLNASGRSPRGLPYDALRARLGDRRLLPEFGPLAVTVPGAVDGWFALHGRFGRLPMDRLLAPAVRYAREGFAVTPVIAEAWEASVRRYREHEADLTEFDNFRRTFLPEGRAPRAGELFANPGLADTLELVARGGRDAFYAGPVAERLDAYARRTGCALRREDLAAHRSEWVRPISVRYRGYDVCELPPNGQGGVALQMLALLEGFDLRALGFGTADYLHLHVEAKKLAFADRARFYADPRFYDPPLDVLLSERYASARRRLIRPDAALPAVEAGTPRLDEGDTVYLATADRDGMMVSLIQSNYMGFGSGLVPDGLGFCLQNRGALFAMEPDHPNRYAPGKRPFHTIIPAFVLREGEPLLSFGVMGGSMQPQGHAQVLCNLIDFGMDVQEAGDAPRYFHRGSPEPTGEPAEAGGGTLALERRVPQAAREELARRGHRLADEPPPSFGGYQAILRDSARGVYHGAAEMRKDGHAAGF